MCPVPPSTTTCVMRRSCSPRGRAVQLPSTVDVSARADTVAWVIGHRRARRASVRLSWCQVPGSTKGCGLDDLLAPARPARRLDWADVAKGACIVLVVLWHVIMKHYLRIGWHVSSPLPGAWGRASELLLPLRMPLFFAISGYFGAAAVGRPWRVLGRTKVAKFLYLYVLWLCVHTALLAF